MRAPLLKMKLALDGVDYDFLRTNPDLGKNLILLKAGGSYGYGTNIEGSDYDARGITSTRTLDMLGMPTGFEQFENKKTDTVIFTVNKAFDKLIDCNPNMIEILDGRVEDALYINELGKLLLDNRKLFLSKRAFYTFGGYARDQLNRLENALAGLAETDEERMAIVMESIETKIGYFNLKNEGKVLLETRLDSNNELVFDLHTNGLKPGAFTGVLNEIASLVTKFNKMGKRNKKKTPGGLSKHAMHLIRLYYMCIDIFEEYEINTYREKEHDILMEIRNTPIQDSTGKIRKDFLMLKDELELKMRLAFEKSKIVDKPDLGKINELQMALNLGALKMRGVA